MERMQVFEFNEKFGQTNRFKLTGHTKNFIFSFINLNIPEGGENVCVLHLCIFCFVFFSHVISYSEHDHLYFQLSTYVND